MPPPDTCHMRLRDSRHTDDQQHLPPNATGKVGINPDHTAFVPSPVTDRVNRDSKGTRAGWGLAACTPASFRTKAGGWLNGLPRQSGHRPGRRGATLHLSTTDLKTAMKALPHDVNLYWTSPEFTGDSLPANLRESHQTGDDTWAKIVVLEGRLRYCILEPEAEEHELSPTRYGIVEPTVPHRVEPIEQVRFRVEFYR